jgi:hypothetical protein
MALNKEIWLQTIEEQLFPNNEFYRNAMNDSAFIENLTVHLPQAGAMPAVVKNRSSFPASASQRTDTELKYFMDEYTTDPMYVTDVESAEFSYDKRMSIMRAMLDTLNTTVADWIAYNWAATLGTNIIETTGVSRNAYHPNQTSTRLKLTFADILRASSILNAQNVPMENRKMLVDAYLYQDLLAMSEFKDVYTLQSGILTNGSIGRVGGFDVFMRSRGIAYEPGPTAVALDPTEVITTNTNLGILCWHPNFVRFALGSRVNSGIKIFSQGENPLYYADVFSALVRTGSSKARTSETGIVSIIEG